MEKANAEWSHRVSHLENEKKIISDNLTIKQQEIEKLKAELEEKSKHTLEEPPLRKERSFSMVSPQKQREEEMAQVEKVKKTNKDLEEAVLPSLRRTSC